MTMLMCESNFLVKIYGVSLGEKMQGQLEIWIIMELMYKDLKTLLCKDKVKFDK